MNEKIRAFINRWKNKGREKQDTQKFWIELLTDVLEVEDATKRIDFEKTVKVRGKDGVERTKFIDAYIPETKVLIEQKDKKLKLNRRYSMSGTKDKYTPYEQADIYSGNMNHDEYPRYIIACNFKEIEVHDNNNRGKAAQTIKLEDLERDYTCLSFLVSKKNEHLEREKELSVQAGHLVGNIYDSLLKMYKNPKSEETLKSLNILIVRLVFILYAEDAGIFQKQQFLNYMEQFRKNPGSFRRELITLFDVLDTPFDQRDPYLEEGLSEFPYVNGGLFDKKIRVEIPLFNKEAIKLILDDAAAGFDWQGISPTIFGATFESTLNPETRRSGGMHYTSLENIHKVIDPLFLDDLKEEFTRIEKIPNVGSRVNALYRYIDRLADLKFFDPACGSGNFLTETYICLRRLENKALKLLFEGKQVTISDFKKIKVSLDQFYGIEINDFAVAVANTALFISEYQMLRETESIINRRLDFLPLHSFDGIHEGNALRMNWNEVVPSNECSYVMGNPPFTGAMWMKGQKREDLSRVFPECKKPGQIDYVSGWFVKAAQYIQNTEIECAFVATNSICQGQQVTLLWEPLLKKYHIQINFAYTTFRWNNETPNTAKVMCVIVGFSAKNRNKKMIFSKSSLKQVDHISPYLTPTEDYFIHSTKKQISGAPPMHMGVMARDGGHLILSQDEFEDYIRKEPQGKIFIKRYMMGKEFLHNIPRHCFWLVTAKPNQLSNCPILLKRIEAVKDYRLNSKAKETRKFAETPTLFCQLAQPKTDFLVFPKVSSEKRRYIPVGFLTPDTIVGDKLYVVEEANLYHFGVLTSNVHNAWMRAVAGRLEMRYSYSNTIVYNTFPWPEPTEKQKQLIEKTAQNILDVRSHYPESSLADLYDERLMPLDLRKAHQINDRAVMEAYGWDWRNMSEEDCVAELMKLYQERTSK